MNKFLATAALALGLAAVGWVGYGYVGSNTLALAMTLLIAAFYGMGAVELHRFRQATAGLATALGALPEQVPSLASWLATLPSPLRHAVRLRVEGERVGLPGPQLTPYLVGLLVLLGMLGTFLGMVVTLNGAVRALESTSDLATMRAALAAPVKGLGLAFGTSVAGVAASAMLGLVTALCRRERVQVTQALDARIATTLRTHSRAHQREQTLDSLQAQARALPEVVGRLDALMAAIAQRSDSLNTTLTAGQDRFHAHAQTAYGALAQSVDRSLKESLTESARAAAATIQPVVEATMAGIARETAALQDRLSGAVAQQLDGIAGRFDAAVTTVAGTWTASLAEHERTSRAVTGGLTRSLADFTQTFDTRSTTLLASVEGRQAALHGELQTAAAELARQTGALHGRIAATAAQQLDGVATRFGAAAKAAGDDWRDALAGHTHRSETLATGLDETLTGFAQTFEARSAALLAAVDDRQAVLHGGLEASASRLARESAAAHERMAGAVAQQLDGVVERFGATAATVSDAWRTALVEQAQGSESLSEALGQSLARYTRDFELRTAVLLAAVDARHAALQDELKAAALDLTRQTGSLHEQVAAGAAQQLAGVAERFGDTAARVSGSWHDALAAQQRTSASLAGGLEQSLAALVQTFEQQSATLIATVERSHAALQAGTAAGDAARLDAWTGSLAQVAATLQRDWQHAGAEGAAQHAAICRTLEQTARAIHTQAGAQAGETIAEMSRLIAAASEAPRAAAEVIGALREQLSASMARDNALLDERSRILGTLDTLLDAVNRGATEQRSAIDALVASSATVLERTGTQFGERVEAEADKLAAAALQVTAGAVEVASLGEAFGAAVQLFGESSEALTAQLQRIEGALAKSTTRSDEQLAYYVAQARELVDLSISSQRQIVDDLQRLSIRQPAPASAAATAATAAA